MNMGRSACVGALDRARRRSRVAIARPAGGTGRGHRTFRRRVQDRLARQFNGLMARAIIAGVVIYMLGAASLGGRAPQGQEIAVRKRPHRNFAVASMVGAPPSLVRLKFFG